MRKILFLFFLLSIPFVLAHAGESHEAEADGKIVEIGFLPSEPKAGSATILSFEVSDVGGKSVTHIDGFLDISKDGKTLVDDYELHSHGNQFSMTYKFPEAGQYTATLTVQPAEGYDSEQFDPISVLFYITAEEKETNSSSFLYGAGILLALIVLGFLVFMLKKK